MKILIISDFHGKISILGAIFETFQKILPDIITFCGDIVQGRARGTAWLKGQAQGKRPDIYSPEIIQEAQEDHNAYQVFFKTLDKIGIPLTIISLENN